jgi:triacylglycerol esterase/lipase EstA (alpha/beta hydrolase family)
MQKEKSKATLPLTHTFTFDQLYQMIKQQSPVLADNDQILYQSDKCTFYADNQYLSYRSHNVHSQMLKCTGTLYRISGNRLKGVV